MKSDPRKARAERFSRAFRAIRSCATRAWRVLLLGCLCIVIVSSRKSEIDLPISSELEAPTLEALGRKAVSHGG